MTDTNSKRKRDSKDNNDDRNIEEATSPTEKKSKTQDILEGDGNDKDNFFDISDEATDTSENRGEKEKSLGNPDSQTNEQMKSSNKDGSKPQEIVMANKETGTNKDDTLDISDETLGSCENRGEREKSSAKAVDQDKEDVIELVTDSSTPANDSSIICLDEDGSEIPSRGKASTGSTESSHKPRLQPPKITLSSIEEGSSNGLTQSSATIFTKLTKKRDSSSTSPPPSINSKRSSGSNTDAIVSEEDKKSKRTTTEESEMTVSAPNTCLLYTSPSPRD